LGQALRDRAISDGVNATAAVAEWAAVKRNPSQPATPGREATPSDAQIWARYTTEVTALREQLRAVPADDRALWAHVARETAGAFAAWSISVEGDAPGPLAATADILALLHSTNAFERGEHASIGGCNSCLKAIASATTTGACTARKPCVFAALGRSGRSERDRSDGNFPAGALGPS